MLPNLQRTASVRDFCHVLFRHRIKAATFFVTVVGLVLVGIVLTPKKYASEAKLFIRLGRESVGLDPTATTGGQTISLSYSRESEIQSLLNLLESRVMFELAVDQLTAGFVLEEDLESSTADRLWTALFGWLPSRQRDDPALTRERAVRAMMDTLTVENPVKSHVFTIVYKAGSPRRAQEVLQKYLDVCLEQYVRVHRNPHSRQFFVEQSELLANQLRQANQELRDAKNEVGLVSVESQRKLLEDNVSNLDRQLLDVRLQLASTNDRIKVLRSRVSEPVDMSAASGLSTRAVDDMRTQLYTLQIREREMVSRYTAEHPNVIAIQEQVAESQQLLDRQELLIELSNAASLNARMESLTQHYEQNQGRLYELNENEARITELERRVEQLTASYRIYATNLEQARIDQELENEHITNIAVAQAPTYVAKPLSRRGQLTLTLGLIVATLGSIGVAHVFEYFDDSLGTPADVESRLGLPVLLSVPRSSEVWTPGGGRASVGGGRIPLAAG